LECGDVSPLLIRTGAACRQKSGDKSPHSKGAGGTSVVSSQLIEAAALDPTGADVLSHLSGQTHQLILGTDETFLPTPFVGKFVEDQGCNGILLWFRESSNFGEGLFQ
jgi:hypothetical protein